MFYRAIKYFSHTAVTGIVSRARTTILDQYVQYSPEQNECESEAGEGDALQ